LSSNRLEQAYTVTLTLGVLAFGVCAGLTFAGVQVQVSDVCQPQTSETVMPVGGETSHPCPVLGGVETQAMVAGGFALTMFLGTFGLVYLEDSDASMPTLPE